MPGFGIRVGKQTQTWIAAVVRPGAKHPVRLKLGTFPAMSLADARQAARQMMAGGAPPPPVMFGELVEVFLRDGRTRTGRPLRPASLRAYRSILKSTAKPLHGRPVHEIRRRDIAALTRKVGAESGAGERGADQGRARPLLVVARRNRPGRSQSRRGLADVPDP